MNVLFVNDTSSFHAGSKAVVDSLCARIAKAGHRVFRRIPRMQFPTTGQIRAADIVIVNGEGSMRGERDGIETERHLGIRRAMAMATAMGKRVFLVNTVWERQSHRWGPVLEKCEGISVREIASAHEMEEQFGISPAVHPDEAWFAPVDPLNRVYMARYASQIVIGGIDPSNVQDRIGDDHPSFNSHPRLKLADKPDWNETVNYLRQAKLYVTGQHHGVYAALKAGCPFIPVRTRTHKVPGLFEWARVKIPICDLGGEAEHWKPELEEIAKLRAFLEKRTPWPIPA